MSSASSSATTYHLRLLYCVLAIAIMLLGLLPGLLILPAFSRRDYSSDQLGLYVFSLVMFIALFDLSLWVGYLILRMRLIVSPQGVAFKAVGYTLRSSWANIAGLETISTSRGLQRGLVLNEPGLEMASGLRVMLTVMPSLMLISLLRGRHLPDSHIADSFIPIGPFESDRLVADLQQHLSPSSSLSAVDQSANMPSDRSSRLPKIMAVIGVLVLQALFVALSVQAWQGDAAPVAALAIGSQPVGLAFTPDGQTLLAATESGELQTWHVADGALQQTQPLTREVVSFAFSADGQAMAAGISDGTVRVWHSDGTLWHNLGKAARVSCPPCASYPPVAFSPDGQTLTSGSYDGTIHVWQLSNSQEKLTLKASLDENDATITGLAFSSDGQMLAASAESLKDTVQVWRLDTGQLMGSFPGQSFAGQSFANHVAFSPGDKLLAVSTLDQGVWLIRPEDRGRSGTLGANNATDRIDEVAAAFSPDGQYVASVTNGGALQIWRLSDSKLLRTLRAHTSQIRQVIFSPDGRYLATGSYDTTVRLWRVADLIR